MRLSKLLVAWVLLPTVVSAQPGSLEVEFVQGGLCTFLGEVVPGSKIPVEVTGIYAAGFEMAIFHDPNETRCELNVQPATWVEFSAEAELPEGFGELLDREGSLFVTFRGYLEGPAPSPPDDPSVPILARMAEHTEARHGHLSGFRTQLSVTEVLRASRIPRELRASSAPLHPPRDQVPRVVAANLPSYPEPARRAHVEGSVLLEVEVEGGKVTSIRSLAGDRLLAQEAIRNIESWEFENGVTWKFRTRFEFVLEKRTLEEGPNPTLELRLPFSVKVLAPSRGW